MKKLLIISGSVLLILLAANVSTADQPQAGKDIDKTIAAQAVGVVNIDIVRGSIDVQTWNKAEVRVQGRLDDDTKQFVFESKGDEVFIEIELKKRWFSLGGKRKASDLTIFVPKQSALIIDNVSSDFRIDGIQGGLSIDSVSGDFRINNIADNIDIDNISGDFTISESGTHPKPFDFKFDSVSGDIEADLGTIKRAELDSVSGDVELHFSLADNGRLSADSVSGDISLLLKNKEINAQFDLDAGMGGDVRTELEDRGSAVVSDRSKSARFTLGDGAGEIDIETISGDIFVGQQ